MLRQRLGKRGVDADIVVREHDAILMPRDAQGCHEVYLTEKLALSPNNRFFVEHLKETGVRLYKIEAVEVVDEQPARAARSACDLARPAIRHCAPPPSVAAPKSTPSRHRGPIVAIGSSTGGIDALLKVLSAFGSDCPPTVLVQHTGASHSQSLIRLLNGRLMPNVVGAEDAMALETGHIYVATGDTHHLTVVGRHSPVTRLVAAEPMSGHRPSVDMLFKSVSAFGASTVAALLTGMGKDGAEGLLEIKQAGGATIGQDEATSTVYGMPRVAWSLGAVQEQLPIDAIGRRLLALADKNHTSQSTRP